MGIVSYIEKHHPTYEVIKTAEELAHKFLIGVDNKNYYVVNNLCYAAHEVFKKEPYYGYKLSVVLKKLRKYQSDPIVWCSFEDVSQACSELRYDRQDTTVLLDLTAIKDLYFYLFNQNGRKVDDEGIVLRYIENNYALELQKILYHLNPNLKSTRLKDRAKLKRNDKKIFDITSLFIQSLFGNVDLKALNNFSLALEEAGTWLEEDREIIDDLAMLNTNTAILTERIETNIIKLGELGERKVRREEYGSFLVERAKQIHTRLQESFREGKRS